MKCLALILNLKLGCGNNLCILDLKGQGRLRCKIHL